MPKRHILILSLILAAKTALLIFAIFHSGVGLGPDEAQYWTWSRHLDWGYYSKPPGIAWEIAAGTYLFGDTELGVRAVPLLLGMILPFLIYLLAKRCALSPAACLWAAVTFALAPMGILSSFLAITDGGMVLFWTAATICLVEAISSQKRPNYFILGGLVCLGALFKWPQYIFWVIVLASWWFYPFLASRKIIWGVLISLIALLPSAYWNASHEWATFRHVFATIGGGHAHTAGATGWQGNPLEYLGAQLALISPILFVLLLIGWVRVIKRREVPGLTFCAVSSAAIFLCGWMASFFMKIQGNWAIFAYPAAFPVIGWLAAEGGIAWRRWTAAGITLSVLLCISIFALPGWQANKESAVKIPYRVNPFRHNLGWERIAHDLVEVGYRPGEDFLIGDKYQTVSILSFYTPGQKQAFLFNLEGSRKNQFSYWPGPDNYQGKRGFFVVFENIPKLNDPSLPAKYAEALSPYFDSVKFLGMRPLFEANGSAAKGMLLFEGSGYKGKMPVDPALY